VIRSPYWRAFKGHKGPWDPQPDSIAEFTWYSAKYRQRRRRRFLIALVATCLAGFASPFAVSSILDSFSSTPKRAESPSIYSRPVSPLARNFSAIPICTGWAHASRRVTCLVDGDTGWEHGVKWRLSDVDTPEISSPGCPNELQLGLAARDRLQRLMATGYTINWLGRTDRYNRQLVNVTLRDGRDAGRVLLGEGLARPFPNSQKAWCSG
jgi:endonuclease YncB( thermonuclease family)